MKKWLMKIVIMLFAVMLIGMQLTYADPPLPVPVGRVVWVKGTLKAIMPNNEERLLQKSSLIYLNDTLITDHDSQAQIVFTDNSLMTFRPDTTFRIDQYEFHPKNKSGESIGKYIMNLIEGGFRTITGLIAKNSPNNYQVHTPVATIGVRGTDYAVYLHGGELMVANYAGTPCVSGGGGSLCLGKNIPFASITVGTPPVPIKEPPVVFKEKQQIVPAKIEPFNDSGTGAGTPGTSGTTNTTPEENSSNGMIKTRSGTVSSFCIQ